jgi:3-oxoacyl-(acyl-carrier-protein) synthase
MHRACSLSMPFPDTIAGLLRADPIVVTGTGCVSRAGTGTAPLWEAVHQGKPGGRSETIALPQGTVDLPAALAPPPAHRLAGKVDRSVLFALAAAAEAWKQAGGETIDPQQRAVVAGTSRGPHHVWTHTENLLRNGRKLPPRLATAGTLAALSGAIAAEIHAHGPGFTVSATCASGASAIAAAAEMLLLGRAGIVVAGGAEAPLTPAVILSMQSTGLLGTHEDPARACRPFDRTRDGMLPGEGAGFLVMERLSHARHRGATVLAQLSGWATAVKGEGRAGVAGDGHALARVMQETLATAGLPPEAVDYLNAHGTGTPLNDRAEAAAIRAVFPAPPPLSSTKAVTGHCLGASPGMEAVIAVECLRHQWLPGSVNTTEPEFDLPFIPAPGRPGKVRHVLSSSLGFWGFHAALLFSSPP